MTNEYIFLSNNILEFPLDDSIDTKVNRNHEYLVSNSKSAVAVLYAPEIDFYVKNTQDTVLEKIKNIKKLYDIRSTVFDYAKDMDFAQEVNNKLLIITQKQDFGKYQLLENDKSFKTILIDPKTVLNLDGHIGNFKVTFTKNKDTYQVDCDQIIWDNAPEFAIARNGVFDSNLENLDDIITKIKSNVGDYHYKNFIVNDSNICQYHERREEICGKCAEVCPTVAILKDDSKKHLVFSHIDCHGCGGCVSVCPSGAMEYAQMPRVAFSKIKDFYKNKIALIIPAKMNIEKLNMKLPQNVLPLAIEGEQYLDETSFVSLVQTSGNPVIFYSDFISKGTGDSIYITNEIFQRKYNKQALFICKDEQELSDVFEKLKPIPECVWNFNESGMAKREIFSARVAKIVGQDDLGVIKTKEHIHYGDISINEQNCTLCLSCVGACNVGALRAFSEDNSLRFNPSICTNCGYCEVSCPEKDCLYVIKDELYLKPSYFTQRTLAKDELFKCVECGVEFATKRSIEKIAQMMIPKFGDDKSKIKALYCCANCKPKVTMQEYFGRK